MSVHTTVTAEKNWWINLKIKAYSLWEAYTLFMSHFTPSLMMHYKDWWLLTRRTFRVSLWSSLRAASHWNGSSGEQFVQFSPVGNRHLRVPNRGDLFCQCVQALFVSLLSSARLAHQPIKEHSCHRSLIKHPEQFLFPEEVQPALHLPALTVHTSVQFVVHLQTQAFVLEVFSCRWLQVVKSL